MEEKQKFQEKQNKKTKTRVPRIGKSKKMLAGDGLYNDKQTHRAYTAMRKEQDIV